MRRDFFIGIVVEFMSSNRYNAATSLWRIAVSQIAERVMKQQPQRISWCATACSANEKEVP